MLFEMVFFFFIQVNNVLENKSRSLWTKYDKEKMQYNLKAKTIITIALGMNEFFCVSHYSNAKET